MSAQGAIEWAEVQLTLDATGQATVFVVDDDPLVRRAFGRLVRGAGYAVETFGPAHLGAFVLIWTALGLYSFDLRKHLGRRFAALGEEGMHVRVGSRDRRAMNRSS